ncbi:hypothetical protein BOTBODRAFT_71218, partial [Botryobasidium botryosum FD-172 SS1]
ASISRSSSHALPPPPCFSLPYHHLSPLFLRPQHYPLPRQPTRSPQHVYSGSGLCLRTGRTSRLCRATRAIHRLISPDP